METLTRAEMLGLFTGHSARELALPDPDAIDWGVLDYLGWVHPSGHRAFVVIPGGQTQHSKSREPSDADPLSYYTGVVLNRSVNRARRPYSQMCAWCHFVHRSRGAAMFSTTVAGTDGRRIIGASLCRDLDCSVRMRNLTGDPPSYMPETLDLNYKIIRLENALAMFLARINRQ